jgi:diaminopimelate epimerase
MKFYKFHALGNDYIILDPDDFPELPTPEQIRKICHRNYGVGSDGILYGPIKSDNSKFGLRIFNPDGSEAEKSGNGLRIFSRYLLDKGRVQTEPFTIHTAGGRVTSRVHKGGKAVTVEMGKVSFDSRRIPVRGPTREVLRETLDIDNETLLFCAATIGNPHCVVLCENISPDHAKKYGPRIESHDLFPNRTNVQFLRVVDRGNIQIEIWERGAGYTLASGSSSSAAAAVARKLGLCDSRIRVHMPGGKLEITVADDDQIIMTGPVEKICEGTISSELMDFS